MHKLLFFLAFTLLVSACDSTSPEELLEELEEEQVGRTMAETATRLTNLARSSQQQCGNESFSATSSLTWSDQLEEAALAHSRDMANNNYFSHTSPDGENPGVRINETGYQAITWGENIAAGYGTVEEVIQGWMDSPGHCRNIMNSSFQEFAVAKAQNNTSTYNIYWTMVLATSR